MSKRSNTEEEGESDTLPPAKVQDTTKDNNYVGIFMTTNDALGLDDKNLVMSPYCLHMAMDIIKVGATDDAIEEIERWFPGQHEAPPKELKVANAIWQDGECKQEFMTAVEDTLGAEVFHMPESVESLNNWASLNTCNEIKKIAETIPPDCFAIMTSVIFMDQEWRTPFEHPRDRKFNGKTTPFLMLEKQLYYSKGPFSTRVSLPYVKGDLELDIILPHEGSNMYASLHDLNARIVDPNREIKNVNLYYPSFKVDSKLLDAKSVLEAAGIDKIFHAGNLKRMTDDPRAFIHSILQSTSVAFTQFKTTASSGVASFACLESKRVNPKDKIVVDVNRSFYFTIRRSNTIYFIGKLVDSEGTAPEITVNQF